MNVIAKGDGEIAVTLDPATASIIRDALKSQAHRRRETARTLDFLKVQEMATGLTEALTLDQIANAFGRAITEVEQNKPKVEYVQ